jgi:hypothetical protein
MKLFKRLWFIKTKQQKPPLFSIGKVDNEGFATVLANGKETNIRLLLWQEDEVKRLQNLIAKK